MNIQPIRPLSIQELKSCVCVGQKAPFIGKDDLAWLRSYFKTGITYEQYLVYTACGNCKCHLASVIGTSGVLCLLSIKRLNQVEKIYSGSRLRSV